MKFQALLIPLLLITACNGFSKTQTYHYIPLGFEFDYPKSYGFTQPTTLSEGFEAIVQIQNIENDYEGTNFSDASLAIGEKFMESDIECFTPSSPNASTPEQVTWKNMELSIWTQNEAAAGNNYDQKVVHTYKNSSCYELVETIHTTNIDNYDPETVTEVDQTPIWSKLDGIARSFRLVDSN